MGKSSCAWIILIFICPGIHQLSRWIYLAGNDICESISSFHSRLYNHQKCFDIGKFIHKGKVHLSACIDNNNNIFVILAKICHHLALVILQIIISFICIAVCAFSGNTAQYIDCSVCAFISFRYLYRITSWHNKGCCTVNRKKVHHITASLAGSCINIIFPVLTGFLINLIVAADPVFIGDLVTCIFQPLPDRNVLTLIYIAGASSTLDCSACACTINSNCTSRFQRQYLVFIFQKNNSLICCFSCYLTMFILP